jgi:transcriptional regulator with XRE-family HTH domain
VVYARPVGDPREDLKGIGDRLREERVKAGLSQRELARRLGVSPSLISQLESGQSNPSVGTLYAIVTELDVSLDRLIRGSNYVANGRESDEEKSSPPLVHPAERKVIHLDSGVRWEQLVPGDGDDVDFLLAVYEVGGASTPDESLMRHHGREYGYVMKGTLGVQVGFEEYELSPGDAIAFDSTVPHRLFNKGSDPVEAVWFVVGRNGAHDTARI